MEITSTRLSELEGVIERGLQTFVEVGNALMEIRDSNLYRVEYDTFEEYCRERWGMVASRARQLIAAAQTVTIVTQSVDNTILPQNEAQARSLTSLPVEQQAIAWLEATTNGQQPTAKIVETVVKQIKTQRTVITREWYTVEQWQNLEQSTKDLLLSQEGTSKFNPTNDNVEWARYTWNPVTGCLHDCPYCYARDIASRFYPQEFVPSFLPDRLNAPKITSQKDLSQFDNPVDKIGYRNVFTCSMADLFGNWVPREWIEQVLKSISDNPQWTFLLLTKFPIKMAEFEYPPNVWLGTTVDYQWRVERAEKAFIKIKATGFSGVCWLSCEPMMERLSFSSLEMFDWVVMGGSSKSSQTPEYRPPFEDIVHLHNQVRQSGCKIYQKTNLIPGMTDEQRIREYPND